jgi:hypothetical protein
MICELEYAGHNSSKGNVLCCGKLQEVVTCSCSRLTFEEWCIALDKVYTFSNEKYMFGCMLSSGRLIVWLCPCNALPTVVD